MLLYQVSYKRNKNAKKLSSKYVTLPNEKNWYENAIKEANVKYPVSAWLVLSEVSLEEAKAEYCKGTAVFILDENDDWVQLSPSCDYGSHASSEELFYRSLEQSIGYGKIPKEICINK